MAEKVRIGLIYGGRSGEHEVSLRSAAAVYKHMDPEVYDCVLIGVSKTGRWYLQDRTSGGVPESLSVSAGDDRELSISPGRGICSRDKPLPVDLILPIIHGSFGEDGALQGALETAGIPYAASGVLGSALGMDKGAVKKVWAYHGLPVVPYRSLRKEQFLSDPELTEGLLDDVFAEFGSPIFVKPNSTGSSLGVRKVNSREECYDAIREAFTYDRKVLLERGIMGREIECAVLDGNPPKVSIPGQILPKGDFYDYRAKYIDEEGAKLIIPADLEKETEKTVRHLASRAFETAETEGFARVDFFVDEKSGEVYINEINTIPGFTSISMFPRLFIESGMTFREIIDAIIRSALKRDRERREIVYSYGPDILTNG